MLPVSSTRANGSKHSASVTVLTRSHHRLRRNPFGRVTCTDMYRRVAVVTDSTACLPAQLTDQLGIEVVQIQVRIGDHTDDESRIPVPDLVSAMRSNVPVATIPPDPGAFFWTYNELAAQGVRSIVSVHVSGRQSATVEAARTAAAQVRVPVHVIDTHTCGMSIGYAVQAAAKVAEAGGSVERVLATA